MSVDYIRLEILMQPLESFILGTSRLALARLGFDPDQDTPAWIDVTGDLRSINTRTGGLEHNASTAIEAGYLSFNARNSLNPFMGWNIHPGLPVRVTDITDARTIWTGTLDDVDVDYDKTSRGYTVRVNASDAVRDLKATTLRGQPGSVNEIATPGSRLYDRIAQIAAAAGVATDLKPMPHGWNPSQILAGTGWTRYGTPPAGYELGVVDYENRVFVRDSISDLRESVDFIPGVFGMRRTLTGLVAGDIYEVSVEAGLFNQRQAEAEPDEHTFTLRLNTGETALPVSVVQNHRRRYARARLVFRASATTHTLDFYRTYEGELPKQSVAYSLGNARIARWDSASAVLPIQAVAYDSSAFNHLVMATNSAGVQWFINAAGDIITGLGDTPVAILSDEHTIAPNHLCFFDIEAGYSTADSVNTLDIDNHGRQPSHEQFEAWITADNQTTFIREPSIERYRPRDLSMDTQLPWPLLLERVGEIFDRHDTPRETIRSISLNALDHPLARDLKIGDLVHIQFRSLEGDYWITGLENIITPTRHTIKLQTTRSLP